MERFGLFGGSFDPVHLGHLLVAQAAREELSLTRLFFIPAAQSPFKPARPPTPANERLRLLRLALAGKDWCAIDEQEIQRGGVSYTIETVRDYMSRFPKAQLFYLIGADHVLELPKWRHAEELALVVELVVMNGVARAQATTRGSAPAIQIAPIFACRTTFRAIVRQSTTRLRRRHYSRRSIS